MADALLVSQEAPDQEQDEMQSKYLVFTLDGQEFAISIKYVRDIIHVSAITRVPNVPDFIKGITNLRGRVIPIIDMRARFGKYSEDYNDRTCIIVVEIRNAMVGLIIDSVAEVLTLGDEQISPPPQFSSGSESRFIQGVGKTESGVRLILNVHAVLDDNSDNGFAEIDEESEEG